VLKVFVKSDGGPNAGGFADMALDQRLVNGRTSFDHTALKAIYDEVQQINASNAAFIPAFHVAQINAAKAGLTGYRAYPVKTYWIKHQAAFTE
jgi:peptide/nickel transport system substrate-binding protein